MSYKNRKIKNKFECSSFVVPYEEYFENGNIKITAKYSDSNKNDILYEEYYENGQLKIKSNYEYINGKKFQKGIYEEYYESGKLKISGNYNDFDSWNKGGDGSENSRYPYEEYYENGQIKIKTLSENDPVFEVVDGMPNKIESNFLYWGAYEEYFENGQLKIKTQNYNIKAFKKDKLASTPYEEYFKNGQLKIKIVDVDDGNLILNEEYFKNGTVKFKYLWEYVENEKYKSGGKLFIPKIVKIIKT